MSELQQIISAKKKEGNYRITKTLETNRISSPILESILAPFIQRSAPSMQLAKMPCVKIQVLNCMKFN